MTKTLEELKAEYYVANRAVNEARLSYDKARDEATNAVESQYGPPLAVCTHAAIKASEALQAERDRLALIGAEDKAPFPVGTILYRWERDAYSARWIFEPVANGVVEIFKPGDEAVGMTYRSISVSDPVIRYIKKDGTRGKKIETSFNRNWQPEGHHPERNPAKQREVK